MFTGQQYDPTGLYFLRARYYDSETGRFITRDPFSGYPDRPQTLNAYLFAWNNPLIYIDPHGDDPISDFLIAIGRSSPAGRAWVMQMAAAVQHLNQQRDVIFFPNENTTWQERLTACTEIGGGSVLGAAAVYQFWAVLAPSAAPFGTLMRAAEFGIKPYWKLRQLTAGTGLISHHIIEKRFAGILGVSQRTIDSVALTVQEHQVFTRAWRQFISYGDGTTSTTKETIWDTAQKMYANYPVLLEAARKALGMQ